VDSDELEDEDDELEDVDSELDELELEVDELDELEVEVEVVGVTSVAIPVSQPQTTTVPPVADVVIFNDLSTPTETLGTGY
jgi:hypothetical protein